MNELLLPVGLILLVLIAPVIFWGPKYLKQFFKDFRK